MLDYDLAELYGYEVKRLNEQVKRNITRFPEDFMFQLTQEEVESYCLKSQIATLNEQGNKRGMHIKKLPYAFTEQGIYMLATVLRGELAEQQSMKEDGISQGISQGTLSTLVSLVHDNLLTVEEAAKRMDMTIEEFNMELKRI